MSEEEKFVEDAVRQALTHHVGEPYTKQRVEEAITHILKRHGQEVHLSSALCLQDLPPDQQELLKAAYEKVKHLDGTHVDNAVMQHHLSAWEAEMLVSTYEEEESGCEVYGVLDPHVSWWVTSWVTLPVSLTTINVNIGLEDE